MEKAAEEEDALEGWKCHKFMTIKLWGKIAGDETFTHKTQGKGMTKKLNEYLGYFSNSDIELFINH